MRAIFQSKFKEVKAKDVIKNAALLRHGIREYLDFIPIMEKLNALGDNYISTFDLRERIGIKPFTPVSKRNLYSRYKSGVVVGAGSGHDCIDLIGNPNWKLYDLQDERMINKAIGYRDSKIWFNKTGTSDGDTITNVADKYNAGRQQIELCTLDSEINESVDFISMDVEGSALDVLSGASQTLIKHKPDLLVSIYHNHAEYLLAIPFLYDFGYDIDCVITSNFLPHQPHLELSLLCKFGGEL